MLRAFSRSSLLLWPFALVLGAIGSSNVWAAPPVAVPTALPNATETEPPQPVAEETPEPTEASDAPSAEPTTPASEDASVSADNEATSDAPISDSIVSTPVVQTLPDDSSDELAEAAETATAAPASSGNPPSASSAVDPPVDVEAESQLPSATRPAASSTPPTVPDSSTGEPEESADLFGEPTSMLWWFLALLAVVLFGVFGWLYTRRQTAPSAVIERPIVSGAIALKSIEEAKLALTLDVVGATKSLRMFTVDYRLRVANRSARAVRELSVTPELSSARKGSDELRGPAVAHGTGETVRIDRVGPHQSEVITGTVQLPVGEIRPLLQGTKPLFVPIMKVQLRLPGLAPAEHTFIIGLPSATSATRLHPLELDLPPGGLPRLETRQVDT